MDYPGLEKQMGVELEVGVELEGRERERGHCNGRFINECRHFELTGTKIKRKMSFFSISLFHRLRVLHLADIDKADAAAGAVSGTDGCCCRCCCC